MMYLIVLRIFFLAGWCESHRQKLLPPPGYQLWSWNSYNAKAAPKEAFYHFKKPPRPHEVAGFKIGQKLECFDGSSFCVATVTNVMDGRILVHFDGKMKKMFINNKLDMNFTFLNLLFKFRLGDRF